MIGYRSMPLSSSRPGCRRSHEHHSRPGRGATTAKRCGRTAKSGKEKGWLKRHWAWIHRSSFRTITAAAAIAFWSELVENPTQWVSL